MEWSVIDGLLPVGIELGGGGKGLSLSGTEGLLSEAGIEFVLGYGGKGRSRVLCFILGSV